MECRATDLRPGLSAAPVEQIGYFLRAELRLNADQPLPLSLFLSLSLSPCLPLVAGVLSVDEAWYISRVFMRRRGGREEAGGAYQQAERALQYG